MTVNSGDAVGRKGMRTARAAVGLCAVLLVVFPARAVAFHFPWDQGHDTCKPEKPPEDAPSCDKCNSSGSPFVVGTGAYTIAEEDVRIPGRAPDVELVLERTYHGRDRHNGPFGRGWTFSFDERLTEVTDGTTVWAILRRENSQRDRFQRLVDGTFVAPADILESLTKTTAGSYVLARPDGVQRLYGPDGRLTGVVDLSGNRVTVTYDETGAVGAISDASGRSLLFTKGSNGKVERVTDPANRVIAYAYDEQENLVGVSHPDGSARLYEYDAANRLTRVLAGGGQVEQIIEYDDLGRVVAYTEEGNRRALVHQDSQRRVRETDSLGRTRTLQYNANGNVDAIVRYDGRTELLEYGSTFLPTLVTDSTGQQTVLTYDERGNILSVRDATGVTTTYGYEPTFNQPTEIRESGGATTLRRYDERGDLVETIDALGGKTVLAYNAAGQLTSETNPIGQQTLFEYNAAGDQTRVTDELGRVSTITYDSVGQPTESMDSEGHRTEFSFDARGRLVSEVDALGGRATAEYDARGNLVSYSDQAGRRWTFRYDDLQRLVQSQDPGGGITAYAYDAASRVAARTDPKGQVTTYAYDVMNRLVTKTSGSNVTAFTYDSAGNLTSVTDNDSAVRFERDEKQRISATETEARGAQPATRIAYSFDDAGRRVTMDDPAGGRTTYQYDALGRLQRIVNALGEQFTIEYDAASRRVRQTWPNGIAATNAYAADGFLSERDIFNSTTSIARAQDTHDSVGNVVTRAVLGGAATTYRYDELYRLVGAVQSAGGGTSDESYDYDSAGNRTESHISATYGYDAAGRLVTDASFQYAYDANGNLTTRTDITTQATTTYVWDAEDQLIGIEFPDGSVASYAYDGLGRRVRKQLGQDVQAFVYDGYDIVATYEGSGKLRGLVTNSGFTDEPLALRVDGASYFYHANEMRSVVALTDATGAVVERRDYDSFGRLRGSSASADQVFAFTGRSFDAESGLYYFRARYYDPRLGRYISTSVTPKPDPFAIVVPGSDVRHLVEGFAADIDVAIGDRALGTSVATPLLAPLSYAYAFNNPITVADPTGENPGLLRALAIAARFIKEFAKRAGAFCKRVRCKVELHPAHHRFGWPFNQKMKHVNAMCYIQGKKGSDVRIQIPYAK